ncbi:MAG: GNAT family N-acetyltransferase [Oscillospiraceae bacterium]|nr:GNAT family N-acetyltransferase [Oscillospiraceae bacterium]
MIERITDKDRKEHIARLILLALPEWFGIPESTRAYIEASRELPFWAAFEDGNAVGFLALKGTGPKTVELHVMGVLPEYHRRGIGAGLWEAAKAYAKAQGYLYAQVKTVASGHYPEYDRTNAFYRAMGFEALECFPILWDARNPCQVYVQYLGG